MPEKKHIITISGVPGSGKSSTAQLLAEKLAYGHFSSGDFMRQIGQKRKLSIDETNKAAEDDPTFDHEVDTTIQEIGLKDNMIIDSRIAFHLIPKSFKVFLALDPHIAAERTFAQIKDTGRYAEDAHSVDELYANILKRIESENKRYSRLYNGLTYTNESQYDLVVDTSNYSVEQVAEQIIEKYTEWCNNKTPKNEN